MEAAFLATYGIDPLDPSVTLRRVWVLLQRLPPGAWPDPEHEASWSVEAYLLAAAVDRLGDVAWITAAVNSKHKPQRPKPLARPGAKTRGKDEGIGSLMAAMKEVQR